MMISKSALLLFLWTIQASSAFVARPRIGTTKLLSSRENGWDASRYERYAPPQSYEEEPYYNQQPPQEYYNNGPPPMESQYNGYENYNPNNDYYYNSPPPPPPEDYSYNQESYNNAYQDRGNTYDNRNMNNGPDDNAPLAPYQGYQNERQPDFFYDDNRRRDEMFPQRRYQSSFDLFDELWEDTNRIFDMMSPFRRGSLLSSSPFLGSPFTSSLLSPFFESPFSSSPFSEMRSLLSTSQESIQPLLEQAEQYLNQDEACTRALGTDIQLGPVVSQSSASSSVNGQTQSLTRLQVLVRGSREEASLLVSADQQGIAELILRLHNGQEIEVRIPGGSRPPMPPPRMPRRREDSRDVIVDAEVVSDDEVDTNKRTPRGLPSAEAKAFPNDWTTSI